ncbi:MAG: hypothetical protein IJU76_08035 [Desulfovibrionaceae bacterium]|nr:hypothetical protein [Desulfovibrionaceae bacterium]
MNSAYFSVFPDFYKNINLVCETAHTDYKADIKYLIDAKVQKFERQTQMSVKSAELSAATT